MKRLCDTEEQQFDLKLCDSKNISQTGIGYKDFQNFNVLRIK